MTIAHQCDGTRPLCPSCQKRWDEFMLYLEKMKPESPLHNGYTMEQWEQIAKLPVPIVCWMSRPDMLAPVKRQLIGVEYTAEIYVFYDSGGGKYFDCEIITEPGYWTPWLGGKCPVVKEVKVLARYFNGHYGFARAYDIDWPQVIAYMVMP